MKILWRLLEERDESVNISHKGMPTYRAHCKFVNSRPYKAWYFIVVDNEVVGSCYLTKNNEIGIQIFAAHQGNGYAETAVSCLMSLHGKELRYLANINPRNGKSRAMFEKLGFRHIQDTLELTPSGSLETSSKPSVNTPVRRTA
jgi:RimJ/RimL family protein N-acetyltransferase